MTTTNQNQGTRGPAAAESASPAVELGNVVAGILVRFVR